MLIPWAGLSVARNSSNLTSLTQSFLSRFTHFHTSISFGTKISHSRTGCHQHTHTSPNLIELLLPTCSTATKVSAAHKHQAHMIASTNASFSPDLAQVWRRYRLVSLSSHRHKVSTTLADHSLLRLVATLGSKSDLKKVSRKAILDVDVIKTCDTIIEPAAPMALRLSGNLL
jgi:hypothetical protein